MFHIITNMYQKPLVIQDFGEGNYLKGANGVGIGGGISLVNSFKKSEKWFYEIDIQGKLINTSFKTPRFPPTNPTGPYIVNPVREHIEEFILDCNFFLKKYKALNSKKLWSGGLGIGISTTMEGSHNLYVLGYNRDLLAIKTRLEPHVGLLWFSPNLKAKLGIHGITRYKNFWGVELQATYIPINLLKGTYVYSNTPQESQGRVIGRASNIGILGHFSFW
ncbi:MAG: hypothetical protein NZ516_02570 [Raineya sp.]|nr:hypothetical protein [Raineya sp.]